MITNASADESIDVENKALASQRESPAVGVKDSVELPIKRVVKKKKIAENSAEKQLNEEQGEKAADQTKQQRPSEVQDRRAIKPIQNKLDRSQIVQS